MAINVRSWPGIEPDTQHYQLYSKSSNLPVLISTLAKMLLSRNTATDVHCRRAVDVGFTIITLYLLK